MFKFVDIECISGVAHQVSLPCSSLDEAYRTPREREA
jgi:hypothetical protein